jgi:Lon protease-like protein
MIQALMLATVLCLPGAAVAQTVAADAAARSGRLPSEIPIFPLPEAMLFPGVARPLVIFEPRYRDMMADALKGDRIIGMVRLRPGFEKDYEGRPPVYEVGAAGRITEFERLPDGRYTLWLQGLVKFRITGENPGRSYRIARVEALPELPKDEDLAPLSALRERLALRLLTALPLGAEPPSPDLADAEFVNTVAQYLGMDENARQDLLERNSLLSRAQALIELLELR